MPAHNTKSHDNHNSPRRGGRQHLHSSRSDRPVPLRANPRPQDVSPTINSAANTVAIALSPAAAVTPVADSSAPMAAAPASRKRALRHCDSSGESNDTGHASDPKNWFNLTNENPSASLDHAMDVDPPFFQKHLSSSPDQEVKGSIPLDPGQEVKLANSASPPQSSGAEDYRSVIDDLTVEIQRLKDELKRYKQSGPSPLRSEKLFEIKVHGLPAWKKRELEATLRDFASGLDASSLNNGSSSARKKSSHTSRMYSGSRSASKQPSSSSGSHRRPVDSAYASMSTGHTSAGTSGRHSARSRPKYSEQKVENYLKEIPSGLYPRHITMSEKQKKKLVVRRLEQLFTGKTSDKKETNRYELSPASGSGQVGDNIPEPAREARILSTVGSNKKSASRDNGGSTSNSNGDQTSLSGSGHGAGANSSPPTIPPPEQRPTRPRDLDPDRAQNPSENIEYLRHLGIAPPEIHHSEIEADKTASLSPDAEGWVYLNLLCNLAQLHIFNVTHSFIRAAVSEKSSKFQISADGCKIRWRGGSEGTKFSSDSSGDNLRKNTSTDDTSSPNNVSSAANKADGEDRWTAHQGSKSKPSGAQTSSGRSAARRAKFEPQTIQSTADSFQYKPLFVKTRSSNEQTPEETGSSGGSREGSYFTGSHGETSGSGSSPRRRRRVDGAIIYYSGAPFCTDLSGDPGHQWSSTGMAASSSQIPEDPIAEEDLEEVFPVPQRTLSGSSLPYRPLSLGRQDFLTGAGSMDTSSDLGMDVVSRESEEDDEMSCDFPWSNAPQASRPRSLEASGLGGVLPDDHFVVTVSTRRSREDHVEDAILTQTNPEEKLTSMIQQLHRLHTSQERGYHVPLQRGSALAPAVGVEYLSGLIKRLKPISLPPPTIFFPPFSTDDSSESVEDLESEADDGHVTSSKGAASRRAKPHQFHVSLPRVSVSSSEERESTTHSSNTNSDAMVIDEEPDSASTAEAMAPVAQSGSSVATAGGGPSGFSSSKEESSDSSSD
ncbi:hypothetical protein jhhlp_003001 [Lomentospora prolificans]|uniref:Frequency clock protein n=1 Tax=Lomentospora prolificans TaxID=41688 RepID=A0A2N3NFL7_9PEZI|nr:hypothetical protein jhhlp_003001 [Lomentospora prolificans]